MSSQMERILMENPARFSLYPIQEHDLFALYKKHVSTFWTASEIDYSADVTHFERLDPQEQHFLKCVLAFFAGSDGIVSENLLRRFASEVQLAEARAFYAFQFAMEQVHSETYSLLLDAIVRDVEEKKSLVHVHTTLPSVQNKMLWALEWLDENIPFAERLIAWACVEGVLFSSSFAAIYWYKRKGILPGLVHSNDLIARDEALHCEFAAALYKKLDYPVSPARCHEIMAGAVSAELAFVDEALPFAILGMNVDEMRTHVQAVADTVLGLLGYAPLYGGKKSPFEFMDMISVPGVSNFFERRVSEYQKNGLEGQSGVFMEDEQSMFDGAF